MNGIKPFYLFLLCGIALFGCKPPPNITITIYLNQSMVKTNDDDYYFTDIATVANSSCERDYHADSLSLNLTSLFDSTGCNLYEVLKKSGHMVLINIKTMSKEDSERSAPVLFSGTAYS
jgi:hypothetical protein